MVEIHCHELTKRYGPQFALNELTWGVETGQSWGLVGPSGAGKTTLLRILAGLEKHDHGSVRFGDAVESGSARPRVGMVFQQLGLWPHLTASQHIECVLSSVRRQARGAIVRERLDEVRLPAECHDKRPSEMSGGEQQRLAVARALAVDPDLLLLDEPLAQVDSPLRAELIALLCELIAARNMTSIYVTHSWDEVSQIADFVGVVIDGRLVQAGGVDAVYRQPINAVVARLTGPVVELPWIAVSDSRIGLTDGIAPITMRDNHSPSDVWTIRPQQLELVSDDQQNRWKVIECERFSFGWQARFMSGEDQVRAPVTRELTPGESVGLSVRELAE